MILSEKQSATHTHTQKRERKKEREIGKKMNRALRGLWENINKSNIYVTKITEDKKERNWSSKKSLKKNEWLKIAQIW